MWLYNMNDLMNESTRDLFGYVFKMSLRQSIRIPLVLKHVHDLFEKEYPYIADSDMRISYLCEV